MSTLAEDGAIARRAPFSDNPRVGQRGRRTQQQILDAALREFADRGYHGASIDRIARRAGCSRVAFYQYFAGRDDVFAQLSAQVDRQVNAAIESLELVTAGLPGWTALRAWVERQADIHDRYRGLYRTWPTAAEDRPSVAAAGAVAIDSQVARLHAKVIHPGVPGRLFDPLLRMLISATIRTFFLVDLHDRGAAEAYPRERVLDALTDVLHRTLFGLDEGVNAHPPGPSLQELEDTVRVLDRKERPPPGSPSPTLSALRAAAGEAFAANGFAATRVDDVVEGAGLSHGAFYRYFRNKVELARVLAREAVGPLFEALLAAPAAGPDGTPPGAELRRWLRRCHDVQQREAAMIRVWLDASLHEPELGLDTASALGLARQQLAGLLRPRRYGDTGAEALVLLAVLDVFGAHPRPPAEFDIAVAFVERGFFAG